jgi:acetyl/propionyl-CoA carboxylase alpha subunit
VPLHGHAIEVRIIAEDPLAGWLPSSGTLTGFSMPHNVRVDAGVHVTGVVPPDYDSLLAKIIAHGQDRPEAQARLREALRQTRVDGVRTNLDLLLATIEHPAFKAAQLHTGFLDEHGIVDELAHVPPPVLAAISALPFLRRQPDYRWQPDDDPWRGPVAWRLGRVDQPAVWLYAGRRYEARVSMSPDGRACQVGVDGQTLTVRLLSRPLPRSGRLRVDDELVIVEHGVVTWADRSYRLDHPPPLSIEDTAADRGAAAGAGRLSAPMPGRIVKIAVERGAAVRPTQTLVVLEAMKMEHLVTAPHAGIVQQVCVEVGQQVAAGSILLELGDEPLE